MRFPTEGMLDQAHERLKEAAYLFGRVCDDLHPEACHCHSLLAKVAFLQGQAAEVRLCQTFDVIGDSVVLIVDTCGSGHYIFSLDAVGSQRPTESSGHQ